ncbi:MAG: hypothetical protein AAF687_06670 [Pseudomonadota bacterium]
MRRTKQLLGTVSAAALIVMSSAPAMAEGIRAGTDITNTVTVTYEVGDVVQTPETDTDVFAVDRRVNVTVSAVDSPKTVNPGEENAYLTFDVTNLSNDVIDLDLDAVLTSGTQADINGNSATFTIYEDTNNDGVFDINDDNVITFLDEVEADAVERVFVVSDIELTASNLDEFDVTLTADAHEADTGADGDGNDDNTLGAELTESSGDSTDQDVVDTVLADGAGATDNANEGDFSAEGTFVVSAAEVEVTKSSSVVSDPVNLTNNPKAIPGAVIKYCIAVVNPTGGALATDISVVDSLPDDVVFVPGSIRLDATVSVTSGTPDSATCTGGNPETVVDSGFTDNSGNANQSVVQGELSDIAGGGSAGLSFEVTIPAVVSGTPTP